MRRHLTVCAFCASLILTSVSAFAEEGGVSASTLRNLGLGDMQILSDAEGIQIRGMSSNDAHARGLSVVSLLVLDPGSGSSTHVVQGSSARASAANGGGASSNAAIRQQSGAAVTLTTGTPYTGTIVGGAGGTASATAN